MICQKPNERIPQQLPLEDWVVQQQQKLSEPPPDVTVRKGVVRNTGWFVPPKHLRGTIAGAVARWKEAIIIDPITQCWNWKYAVRTTKIKNNKSYPLFRVLSKKTLVHRFAYEYTFGGIPDGLIVMHKCDNELCSNPDHLKAGTQLENVHDCISKKRDRVHCSKNLGVLNPNSQLDPELVRKIRSEYRFWKVTAGMLAKKYNVGKAAVYGMLWGVTWKHVP